MAKNDDTKQDRKIFIVELSELVNRRPATIRSWERNGMLPKELLPQRSDRGWRYWTESQVGKDGEKVKDWMKKMDLRPGKGLAHYKPSDEELAAHLEGQRQPRKNREDVRAAIA